MYPNMYHNTSSYRSNIVDALLLTFWVVIGHQAYAPSCLSIKDHCSRSLTTGIRAMDIVKYEEHEIVKYRVTFQ